MSREDAASVIHTMAKYKDFFVDIMMAHELQLQVPEADHVQESFREGVVMFCSFAFFGAVSTIQYIIHTVFNYCCGVLLLYRYMYSTKRSLTLTRISNIRYTQLPLLGYVIIPTSFPNLGEESLFISACVVTGVTLFLMGSVKSHFSAQNWFHSGMETLTLGGACATVAFTVGQLVGGLAQKP
jgi:hypothetical protein